MTTPEGIKYTIVSHGALPSVSQRNVRPDDRGERSRAGQALQGVCKDCHAGTLNNDLYEVFHLVSDNDDNEFYACKNCGSTHLDLL